MKRLSIPLAVVFLALLSGCSSAAVPVEAAKSPPPPFPHPAPFQKVFVVVLENADAKEALKQPFLRKLAERGALLTQSGFAARPSQPNYIALTAGSIHSVSSNGNVTLDARHLGNLLEEHGKTWKSYAEDYPGEYWSRIHPAILDSPKTPRRNSRPVGAVCQTREKSLSRW